MRMPRSINLEALHARAAGMGAGTLSCLATQTGTAQNRHLDYNECPGAAVHNEHNDVDTILFESHDI